jgi:hypothetical protein
MFEPRRFPKINISAIPVSGVGGLGLLAVVGIAAVVIMEVRIFLMLAFVTGSLLGLAMIAIRRAATPGSGGPTPHVFEDEARVTWMRRQEEQRPDVRQLRFVTG